MNNEILNKFESYIKVKIEGRNIELFIKRLYKNNINIYDMKKINRNKIIIKIKYCDYDKLIKLKTIYEINSINTYGVINIKKLINKNRFIIISLLFSFIFIMILSNIIFRIDIIHSSSDIRSLINNELSKYGIKKYNFKKSYNDLKKIKDNILKDNKDKLEWIEIENIGTTVRVKCEERILNDKEEVYKYQNVVAKKDGIIKKIIAKDGFINYEINDYVKKGDILISGEIYNPSGKFLGLSQAIGEVYAEVWYKLKIEYPLIYSEKKYTGNTDTNYEIIIFNNRYGIGNNKFKNSDIQDEVILKNPLLPIKFVKSTKKEIVVDENINTYETALIEAQEEGRRTMEERLGENEKILYQKTLSFLKKDSTIETEIFFSVMENIAQNKEIFEKDYIIEREE